MATETLPHFCIQFKHTPEDSLYDDFEDSLQEWSFGALDVPISPHSRREYTICFRSPASRFRFGLRYTVPEKEQVFYEVLSDFCSVDEIHHLNMEPFSFPDIASENPSRFLFYGDAFGGTNVFYFPPGFVSSDTILNGIPDDLTVQQTIVENGITNIVLSNLVDLFQSGTIPVNDWKDFPHAIPEGYSILDNNMAR